MLLLTALVLALTAAQADMPAPVAVVPTAVQALPGSPLAPGRRIYVVRGAERDDLADLVTDELKAWGRWPVVDHQDEADLFATVGGKGSNQKGTVTLTITRTLAGPTLWQSTDSGRRWLGTSGFVRALAVIIERLKEASDRWPQN